MHVTPTWMSTQPLAQAPAPGTSGTLVQTGLRTSQSADLQIVTADGDKVTISSDRSTSVGYAGFRAAGGGTSVEGQALQVSSESSVSLKVEGSLDADEVADIRKVVKLLERAASSQDAGRLLKRLSRPDLDSIASVQGSVEQTTEYRVVAASGTLPAGPAAPPPTDPAPQPVPPAEQAGTEDPPSGANRNVGDFLFTILASMLRSPAESKAA